jgi:hypothetical protein
MSWLDNLLGRRGADGDIQPLDATDVAAIRLDLDRLSAVTPDLAAQALRYVVEGDNDSLLLTLEQNKQKAAQALNARAGWTSAGNWVAGRSQFILAPKAWRPEALRRYGQILAIMRSVSKWPEMPGTAASPGWFRAVLYELGEAREATESAARMRRQGEPLLPGPVQPTTVEQLCDLLALEGDSLLPILDVAFNVPENSWRAAQAARHSPEGMPGFDDFLSGDPAARCAELTQLAARSRAYGLRGLARRGLTDGPWFEFAFAQASDSSKLAREAAVVLLRAGDPAALLARTEAAFAGLKPPQRTEIARAVSAACGEAAAPALRRLLAEETNAGVLAELKRLVGQDDFPGRRSVDRQDGPDGYAAVDGTWLAVPPAAPLPEDAPLTPALRLAFEQGVALWREEARRFNEERAGVSHFRPRAIPAEDLARTICTRFDPGGAGFTHNDAVGGFFAQWGLGKERAAVNAGILAHPDFTLWHLLRAVPSDKSAAHGYWRRSGMVFWALPISQAIRARLRNADLRMFADACIALGEAPDALMRVLLEDSYIHAEFDEFRSEQVWPLLARGLPMLDEALGLAPPSSKTPLMESRALNLLGFFPKTPARYFPALIERAIGDRKLVRQRARELLSEAPGLEALLIPLIEHPKQEMRTGAASWIAERRATAATPALLAAARKESSQVAKAALIGAASRLGGDITEFVAPSELLKEAKAGLKKTSVKALDWFPFDALPALVTTDGQPLAPEVARWWVVLTARLKQPGGNPWFELLLDQLAPASAAKLSAAVLQAWVAYDTVRPSDAEANAHAQAGAQALTASYQRWDKNFTYEQAFAMLRRNKLSEYENSGVESKGVLGLATRMAGADAVAVTKAFFRDHYPRTAQCKALLECLAGNPSPLATQYVLTIAKRWRTRTVQELAGTLVQAIADRRGWTPDQLADRTIPSAGFDEDGLLRLPVGEREYTARLDAQGKLQLFNPDGKAVQGLPSDASAQKDPALAESKAALSAARKETKQVFDFQGRRLYEALCVGRAWPAEEWAEHLLRHPLAGQLAQRLLWLGYDAGGVRSAAFRPLEDRTLTDAADAPVTLDALATVRLAHRTLLAPAEVEAWRAHLADYEVAPLFNQLDRPVLALAPEQAGDNIIADRRGWLIEAFKLRGAAAKLDYTRGPAEDGGVFITYEKRFASLELAAVVEFTGNGLPEENRLSALLGLQFAPIGRGGRLRTERPLALKDVPPVLLSEAWNDFHGMAAAGAGFDADWEKKAAW